MGFECGAEFEIGRKIMGERCTAIVLAAGQGRRMKNKIKKQFLNIAEKPIVYYSLHCFESAPFIDDIILVTSSDCVDYCRKNIVDQYGFRKVKNIVVGGKERYDSVYAGLLACENTDYVFIHDGTRPFIDIEMLRRALDGAKQAGACVVGMPSKDTVKIVDKDQFVTETPERSRVWTVQTPQVFQYHVVREAHDTLRKGNMEGITDDSMVVEKHGKYKVKMVEGSYENLKITTPDDLFVAEVILRGREVQT